MSATADFLLADDVDLELNPETYQDAAGPLPVIPGTYRLRVETLKPRKTKDGAPVTRSSKLAPGRQFPVYVIEKLSIVEPVENERTVMPFQDISTAPFLRGNVPAGQLQDILRSYDVNIAFSTMNEGIQQWLDLIANKQTFLAYLDWSAYDSEYAKTAIADAIALSAGGVLADDVKNNIYNKAKVRGYKKFPRTASGGFSHVWTGPTGNTVEGRAVISRFLRSDDDKAVLGPVKDFRKE